VNTFSRAIRDRRVVEIEYLKGGEEEASIRLVEPYVIERELPVWRVHTWDRTRDAERSFRLDRMRKAKLTRERFEPRDEFDPHGFSGARPVRIWYSPEVARWEIEKGAHPLADGSAVSDRPVGSEEWLVGEILSHRGEASLLEPDDLRSLLATRARELERELGLTRVRLKT
jgi:proteasome accessory factor C